MMNNWQKYYVPEESKWPFIGAVGLFFFAVGAAATFNAHPFGPYMLLAGVGVLVFMMYGWFSHVISESQQGLYSAQMDRSFRWGMFWFIFSEVMFFAVFFGALFYVREFAVPWLAGASNNAATNAFLWSDFSYQWPLINNPDPSKFTNPRAYMKSYWLPTINTLILLTSSITLTIAHHKLIAARRAELNLWLLLTIILGVLFIGLQGFEYYEAYENLGLKLSSGIYGTTFFMLTGFHGMHVTIGTIMLITMLLRCYRGHFSAAHHFGFEAAAWYWHFVDVVWLALYLYVYILPVKLVSWQQFLASIGF